MIKILQFGEGNFLRAFAEAYFNELNNEGGEYEVHIVKPRPQALSQSFIKQNNRYNVVMRGYENGEASERVCKINCVKSVFSPFENLDAYYALARSPELKIIISNTTEAGICYNDSDGFDGFESITFPAKLTKLLFERYNCGKEGVYILPAELIDNNADELKACVDKYIALWNLPLSFKEWNDTKNYYCNTLVDRIVSGYPKDLKTLDYIYTLLGEKDDLVTVCEPFGLWAIENKGDISRYVKEGKHNVNVVLTNDIPYYKKRKVRVLNGSHTNMVAAGIAYGKSTVYDFMLDNRLRLFYERTLNEEIVPFVSDNVDKTNEFAAEVSERFLNPYLNHALKSIALNSISKWRARCLNSFKDYYSAFKKLPHNLTVGFSYLMASYKLKPLEQNDSAEYIDYFVRGGDIAGFMAKKEVWGEDLTLYNGFAAEVVKNVSAIESGEQLI